MQTDVFFGHYCPICRTAVGVAASVGSEGKCPTCGGPLVAGQGGPSMQAIANYTCPKCKSFYGFMSVVGADTPTCRCGEPIHA